jgi:hypothetical protein
VVSVEAGFGTIGVADVIEAAGVVAVVFVAGVGAFVLMYY